MSFVNEFEDEVLEDDEVGMGVNQYSVLFSPKCRCQ